MRSKDVIPKPIRSNEPRRAVLRRPASPAAWMPFVSQPLVISLAVIVGKQLPDGLDALDLYYLANARAELGVTIHDQIALAK